MAPNAPIKKAPARRLDPSELDAARINLSMVFAPVQPAPIPQPAPLAQPVPAAPPPTTPPNQGITPQGIPGAPQRQRRRFFNND